MYAQISATLLIQDKQDGCVGLRIKQHEMSASIIIWQLWLYTLADPQPINHVYPICIIAGRA